MENLKLMAQMVVAGAAVAATINSAELRPQQGKAGYIYIFVNDGQIGLVKIGKADGFKKRKDGLFHGDSGVPCPFKLICKVYVENVYETEKIIHMYLKNYRFNPRREHFTFKLRASGGDWKDLSGVQMEELLLKEVIEPVSALFDELKKLFVQPDKVVEEEKIVEVHHSVPDCKEFIKLGLEHCNGSVRGLAAQIISNSLPEHLKLLNPRKDHVNTKDAVISYLYRHKIRLSL